MDAVLFAACMFVVLFVVIFVVGFLFMYFLNLNPIIPVSVTVLILGFVWMFVFRRQLKGEVI